MDKNLLSNICQVISPSGHEESIREFILNEVKDYADECTTDALGNLIVRKKGPGKKMMLAAHMDQIGFMITHIDDEGFLRFTILGGISEYNLFNRRVKFLNGTVGVIACERVEDMKKDFSMEKLYIDIGAKNKEEAEKVVSIGDVCVYAGSTYMNENIIMTPYLDDRIGCFILIEALKRLKNTKFETYFVFTVQEEVGLRGAKTSAYSIDPDYGIAVDIAPSHDTPNALKYPMKIGAGAGIKIKDASVLCHPTIVNFITKIAKENGIKHQPEMLSKGGTDSGAIHLTKEGVPSGGISIIIRNVHSDNEMCAVSDVEAAIELTIKILESGIE